MRLQLIVYHKACGEEEAGAGRAVEKQQNSAGQKDAERQQAENCSHEPTPDSERHAEQSHARGTEINRGGDEIQRTQQRREAEQRDADDPERLPHSFAWSGDLTHSTEWRVTGPTADWRAAGNHEGRNNGHEREKSDPERKHVQARESHIRGANLNGQKIIAETALRSRSQDEKNHDGAVHGYERKILFGSHNPAAHEGKVRSGIHQVKTHQERKNNSNAYRGQGEQEILNANDFVIDAKDIFTNEPAGLKNHRVPGVGVRTHAWPPDRWVGLTGWHPVVLGNFDNRLQRRRPGSS